MPERNVIFHNLWLKLFSIALGTVIWMAIHYNIQHDFSFDEPGPTELFSKMSVRVPVSLVKQPGDRRSFKVTPSEVQLTILGEPGVLRGPSAKIVKAHVDLTEFNSTTASMEEVHADPPNNVSVIKIEPPAVSVIQTEH